MTPLALNFVRFGNFELNPLRGELRKHGLRVRLTPQAMKLLCILVETPIRTRTREEIQHRLWGSHTFVDYEHSLNKIVHYLREALGDSPRDPRYIETVAARGYRFVSREVDPGQEKWPFSDRTGRIAVLPIAAEREADLKVLGSWITSSLVDQLSGIDGVRVIAEGTIRECRLEEARPRHAGEVLKVQLVLSGELTGDDKIWYLRTELIDAADGAQICGVHVKGKRPQSIRCAIEAAQEVIRLITPALVRSLRPANAAAQAPQKRITTLLHIF